MPWAHAQLDQLALGFGRKVGREQRQHAVGAFEQQNFRLGRIDVAEIVAQRVVGDLAQRAGQFHTSGSPAHNHERQPGLALFGIGFALGLLEGIRIRRRISVASSMVFRPGAIRAHSS